MTCGVYRFDIGPKNSFYGKHHSKETKLKISKSNASKLPANSKAILIDGVVYKSATYAGLAIGCVTATMLNRVRNSKFPIYGENE